MLSIKGTFQNGVAQPIQPSVPILCETTFVSYLVSNREGAGGHPDV